MTVRRHLAVVAAVLGLLAACTGAVTQRAVLSDPDDESGLGGTGVLAREGIGGTGIVGAITGFGSIFVNGIEVEIDAGTQVFVDGAEAPLPVLRRGQVVSLRAVTEGGGHKARELHLRHEVVGPVAAAGAGRFRVLGQVVRQHNADPPAPGSVVAVSGFRDAQGVIHATLVRQVAATEFLVTGMVQSRRGGLFIGDLPLAGGPPVGTEVRVRGRLENGVFRVRSWQEAATLPFASPVERLVWQGFPVHESGGQWRLPGTGVRVTVAGSRAHGAGPVRLELRRSKGDWHLVRLLPEQGLPLGRPRPSGDQEGMTAPRGSVGRQRGPGASMPRPPAGHLRRGPFR